MAHGNQGAVGGSRGPRKAGNGRGLAGWRRWLAWVRTAKLQAPAEGGWSSAASPVGLYAPGELVGELATDRVWHSAVVSALGAVPRLVLERLVGKSAQALWRLVLVVGRLP